MSTAKWREKRKRMYLWLLWFIGIMAAIFVFGLYVGGYWGQYIARALHPMQFIIVDKTISGIITYAFTKPIGKIGFWATACILAYFAFVVYRNVRVHYRSKMDDRRFERAESGTYGTAKFMTEDDLRRSQIFDVCEAEKTKGFPLGQIPASMCLDEGVDPKHEYRDIVSMYEMDRKGKYDKSANYNVFVLGPPGLGKSRAFILPNILQSLVRGESIVVNDPKGELYRETNVLLRKCGYNVKAFNLKDMQHSDAWNPFTEFINADGDVDVEAVQTFSRTFIENTAGAKAEQFFEDGERNLLTALCLYQIVEKDNDITAQKSMGGVFNFTGGADVKKLVKMFEQIKSPSPTEHPAKTYIHTREMLQENFYGSLRQRMQDFGNEMLCNITNKTEIDLGLPVKQRCAYFVVMDDTNNIFQYLSATFFTFLFRKLKTNADNMPVNERVPVNVFIDEFASVGAIPDFDRVISNARGRFIRVSIVVQAFSQIQDMYHGTQAWRSIKQCCQAMLVLGGSNDMQSLKEISDLCDTLTTKVKGTNLMRDTLMPKWLEHSYRQNVGEGKRALVTPGELRQMHRQKTIAIVGAASPLLLDKFDYSRHPLYEHLEPDGIENHVPEWYMPVSMKEIEMLNAEIEKEKGAVERNKGEALNASQQAEQDKRIETIAKKVKKRTALISMLRTAIPKTIQENRYRIDYANRMLQTGNTTAQQARELQRAITESEHKIRVLQQFLSDLSGGAAGKRRTPPPRRGASVGYVKPDDSAKPQTTAADTRTKGKGTVKPDKKKAKPAQPPPIPTATFSKPDESSIPKRRRTDDEPIPVKVEHIRDMRDTDPEDE
ncbi:MAG: type IV secretory system conjugative DNA transfer family protein [Eubacteriales bacterium]|nr:type IV secretory system conjugative DNA transfer family protein [Eubacteriales bacterium]